MNMEGAVLMLVALSDLKINVGKYVGLADFSPILIRKIVLRCFAISGRIKAYSEWQLEQGEGVLREVKPPA